MKHLHALSSFTIVLLFTAGAIAQTPDGAGTASPTASKYLVEVQLGYGLCTGEDCDQVDGSFAIHGTGLYRVLPNIMAGVMLDYQSYSAPNTDSIYALDVGLAGRYAMTPIPCPLSKKPLTVFGHLGIGWSSFTISFAGESDSTSGLFIEPGAGVSVQFTPTISAGLIFKLQYTLWDDDQFDAATNIFLGLHAGYSF